MALTPTALAERVILLEGWRAHLLALVAGGISALALAPWHLFPLLFLTLPLFVWLLDGAVAPVGARGLMKFWPAFRTGWWFGFGYFLAGLWWIGKAFLVDAEGFLWLLPFAVVGLPAGLALFWGLGAALARLAWADGWLRIVAFAACLTLVEFARGTVLTGFPWNLPGYAFMATPVMMQSANLIGAYGVTFFTLLIAASPAIFAPGHNHHPWRGRALLIAMAALFVTHLGYGFWTLSTASTATVPNVKLRLVQPAIDQREKWLEGNATKVFQTHLDLTRSNTGPSTASPAAFTHIIWPESAFPFILAEQRDALAALDELLPPHTSLITGAMRREPPVEGERDSRVFNSALVLNGNGEITAARDKTQLVPFGEFLPFQEFLESLGLRQLTNLRGGFAVGSKREPITLEGIPPFLTLICYEVIFPGKTVPEGQRPGWIVNLTNDAWFGETSGPYQHAHQTRVRAVEEGLPIVRVANTGISFVTDPYGQVAESLPLGARAVLDTSLPVALPPTLFSRTGNLPIMLFVCLLFVILVGIRLANTNRLQ